MADLLAREEVQERSERSFRIGISGPPGVGKSTLIEALGTAIIQQKHRLAVLVRPLPETSAACAAIAQ